MANWGVTDFDTSVEIDIEALHRRILVEDPNAMIAWPFEGPLGFDKETVRRYCVDTTHNEVADWQRVRLSMKGQKTHEKLAILKAWWDKNLIPNLQLADADSVRRSAFIQVYNYLGALRRGGQLDDKNRIRKYI